MHAEELFLTDPLGCELSPARYSIEMYPYCFPFDWTRACATSLHCRDKWFGLDDWVM